MMSSKSAALLVIFISVLLCGTAIAKPILDDLFRGFIPNAQLENDSPKETTVVKRRIYDNPDGRLKQVSLQSIIGNLEDSLYQTALSLGSVSQNGDSKLAEVKPDNMKNANNVNGVTDLPVIKRQTSTNDEKMKDSQLGVTTESSADMEARDIFLQTTQNVAANNGIPAHVLIDRVSVQPHEGGIPIIPAFQVYHTKVIQTTFKDSNANANASDPNSTGNGPRATKISIAQTAVQATNTGSVPVITISTSNQKDKPLIVSATTIPANTDGSSSTNAAISTEKTATLISTTAAASTTKAPIVQLKENEEALKEKVAEIEAEPIILTARV